MSILTKKEMSEEDIKFQYITPALLKNWDKSRITMETKITDGQIKLNGNLVHRDKKVQNLQIMYFTGIVVSLLLL